MRGIHRDKYARIAGMVAKRAIEEANRSTKPVNNGMPTANPSVAVCS